jgi:hypothetical protein
MRSLSISNKPWLSVGYGFFPGRMATQTVRWLSLKCTSVRTAKAGVKQSPEGTWDARAVERIIRFPRSITTQWIKFVAKREIRGQQFTSLAEIDIIPGE